MNYLAIGPEDYLKEEFFEKLKKSFALEKGALDFEVFTAGTKEIAQIINSLKTPPFLSKKRMIIIKTIEKFSPLEKDSILKYLKSAAPFTCAILESKAKESNKFIIEVSKLAKVVRFYNLSPNEVNVWIRREFAARKKKISPNLANRIKESCGKNIFLLKNEIEKILLFAGAMDEITESHVEGVLGKSLYRTTFELVNFVLRKKPNMAFTMLHDLLMNEKPHQVLSLLAWQFRNFSKIKNLPKNTSQDAVSRVLGISRSFTGRIMEQSRNFTQDRLDKNLEIILEADFSIKRGKLDGRSALERVVVQLSS